MIKNIILMLLIVCTLAVSSALAQSDSLSAKPDELTQTPEKEGYPIYAIGGVGVALGTGMGPIFLKTNPAVAIGVEFPFTKAHFFAFQLYSYAYFGKDNNKENDHEYNEYVNIGNNDYGQFALLGEIKCYTNSIQDKFRVSFNLGYLFSAADTYNFGIDFGIGACYKLSENLFTELNLRMNLGRIDFGGNSGSVPDLLMLNMYYNINGK